MKLANLPMNFLNPLLVTFRKAIASPPVIEAYQDRDAGDRSRHLLGQVDEELREKILPPAMYRLVM